MLRPQVATIGIPPPSARSTWKGTLKGSPPAYWPSTYILAYVHVSVVMSQPIPLRMSNVQQGTCANKEQICESRDCKPMHRQRLMARSEGLATTFHGMTVTIAKSPRGELRQGNSSRRNVVSMLSEGYTGIHHRPQISVRPYTRAWRLLLVDNRSQEPHHTNHGQDNGRRI
nr:hypothetical protein CFP56_00759 [Quercus suber]